MRSSDESAFLASVVAFSEDAIWSKTLDGIITSWNPAAERIFGYSAKEMVGQPAATFIPPDRRGEEATILDQIGRGKPVEPYQTKRQRKDGTLVDLSLSVSPVRNRAGKIIGAGTIGRNISRQRQLQEKLIESEERLRVTLLSIGDAVIATDTDGKIVFMNPIAERLTGWTKESAMGVSLDEVFRIFNEDTGAVVENPLSRVLREGIIVGLANHTILRSKLNKDVPIDDSAAPIRSASGTMIGAVLVFRDVTERRLAEAAHRRLAAVVDSSDDAIVSKTLEGIITSWNRGAERLFGYFAEEVIGKHISILFPSERIAEETMILARIKRGERIEHYETVRLRKDGSMVSISLSVSPIKDNEGRIIGISKIARDTTHRRLAEQALHRAQQELEDHARVLEKRVAERTARLEETNKSLESLSYSIAHDLRAPLRSIRGLTEILLEDYAAKFDDTGRDYGRRIVESAGRMDSLINDLLDYGRLSQIELPLSLVDTAVIIEKVLMDLHQDVRGKQAKIEVRKPLPKVVANPTILEQTVTNLLSNSLKFVLPGRTPEVTIAAQRNGRTVRLSFRDNGIGIPSEHHGRIFHLFERLDVQQGYPGTGVGLAIVQKGVERMGGRVGVDSSPGKGSTFWIELPGEFG
jgi:PAS domain S-box-containing protein